MSEEQQPSSVSQETKQDGEVLSRWWWTEPSVWTERMLTALENGVKGGKWFSLIDKVFSEQNLISSYGKVAANAGAAGVDHVSVEEFGEHLQANVAKLSEALRQGSYRPQSIRRVEIPKPGSKETRPLGIATVRDRVVQGAIRQVIEPIFEKEFAQHSYGFRPGRGCKDALRRVSELLGQGHHWVVDVDLRRYFDTIPRERLMDRLKQHVSDGRLLQLIESFLEAEVSDGLREWQPESGVPQGAVISPLLSNVYLNPLDHQMASSGFAMVRYADDFVILCTSKSQAEQALAMVRQWCEAEGLEVHAEKTRIVEAEVEGFDFLGYHFTRRRNGTRSCWASRKSVDKLKQTLKAKTKRTDGRSLLSIIADVNITLIGWFGYFKHSYKTTFPPLDGWIRGRLRSILRKRRGLRGRGRGQDHKRWPIAYFAERGYFSLERAYVQERQSPCG